MMGIWIGNAEGGGTDWRAFDMGTVAVGACGAVPPFLDRETRGRGHAIHIRQDSFSLHTGIRGTLQVSPSVSAGTDL